MRIIQMVLLLISFMFVNQALLHAQTPVTVSCTEWPPQYYLENNEIKGDSYEIAKAVMDRAGIKADYLVVPWKRVYLTGLETANYMIACLARTQKRENLFHWIGEATIGDEYSFYSLKSSPFSVSSIDDILRLSVGVLRGGQQNDYVLSIGHKDIQAVTHIEALLKLLTKGRVDVILTSGKSIKNMTIKHGIDINTIQIALMAYKVSTYLAFGKKTPDELVLKAKQAYMELRSEGKIIPR